MKLRTIIKAALMRRGYSGLYNSKQGCGCGLNGLSPGDDFCLNIADCEPAHEIDCHRETCDNDDCEGRDERYPKDKCYTTTKEAREDGK